MWKSIRTVSFLGAIAYVSIGCVHTLEVQAAADELPKQISINVADSVAIRFVLVPPGNFKMGSSPEEQQRNRDEGPKHTVEITKPFYISVFEVTQQQYETVMGANPSMYKGATRPIEGITWGEATKFCDALSTKLGKAFRLPTEAEWEYACRGGTRTPYYTGDSLDTSAANFANSRLGGAVPGTMPVGAFKPNPLGLYDMHGNIEEWCKDWYSADYYAMGDNLDPQGPVLGEQHVARGGCWMSPADCCRCAARDEPVPKQDNIGFRVVLDSDLTARKHVGKTLIQWRTQLMSGATPDVRLAAVDAFGEIGQPAIPLLGDIVRDTSRSGNDRVNAILALGKIGSPATRLLEGVLKDKDSSVRRTAVAMLVKVGINAIPSLARAAESKDEMVRLIATSGISGMGKQARSRCRSLLQGDDLHLRISAAVLLHHMGEAPQVWMPVLRNGLHEKDVHIRRHTTLALAQLDPNVIGMIDLARLALKDEDVDVRYCAILLLSRQKGGEKNVDAALQDCLKDANTNIRVLGAATLWKRSQPRQVWLPILIELLQDKDASVRRRAIGVLGAVGQDAKEAIPALEALARDQDADVRSAALEAIQRIRPPH